MKKNGQELKSRSVALYLNANISIRHTNSNTCLFTNHISDMWPFSYVAFRSRFYTPEFDRNIHKRNKDWKYGSCLTVDTIHWIAAYGTSIICCFDQVDARTNWNELRKSFLFVAAISEGLIRTRKTNYLKVTILNAVFVYVDNMKWRRKLQSI